MDKIAVIDFGGQYAHLIATRIRRKGVYSEIFSEDVKAETLREFQGIILSGGPQSVYDVHAPHCDKEIFAMGIPILGICYGHQFMNYILGGKVSPGQIREFGLASVKLDLVNPLFMKFEMEKEEGVFQMWMSHGDEVSELAPGFESIGSSPDCKFAAACDNRRQLFGVQFHPEVTHSLQGNKILDNFVFEICKAKKSWEFNEKFLDEKISDIKKQVGEKKVFLLISGGVDSTVAFAMIARAIGNERVYGLFVDTGFMRLNEKDEVEKALRAIGVNLHVYNAWQEFFGRLSGVSDPEKKRIIIGDTFLEIKDKVAEELNLLGGDWLLGQGTIYPDTIESGGTKRADKIKTHHNRVDKIVELKKRGQLIEPLVDLYKDEVRKMGELLGLPKEMVWRHPFPGPGLAVRCLCVNEEEKVLEMKKLRQKLNEFIKDLLKNDEIQGNKEPLHEAYAAIRREGGNEVDTGGRVFQQVLKDDIDILSIEVLPLKSVGVQGDARSYKHAAIICGNYSSAGKIGNFWQKMAELSPRITNKFTEFNRVLFSLSPEKVVNLRAIPQSFLNPERIQLLQKADFLTTQLLKKYDLYDEIWQFPVVMIPVQVNEKSGESIILRPVLSTEAMTAEFARLPGEFLRDASFQISALEGISGVFYDITNKPPATIEWE